ncbi:MAG: DUF2244 domain-containing protein [Aquabacterium sp.]|nr:MAG: DUF2244 domain-containing protein [Aquabacterium sp.]
MKHVDEGASASGKTGAEGAGRVEWLLKRNCSVSPGQVLAFFVSIGVVSLVIAAAFWLHGVTFILPFTCLELLAVAVALLVFARHAGDHERVCLDDGRLIIERHDGNAVERWEWSAEWVQVDCRIAAGGPGLIEFSGQGRRAEVGRHVRAELRRPLAREFSRVLHAAARG